MSLVDPSFSRTARDTGYGTRRCPWLIRAPRGQHIKLTLYDFTVVASVDHAVRRHVTTPVVLYLKVEEVEVEDMKFV